MVRIRPPPPRKTAIRKDGGFLWWKKGWMDSKIRNVRLRGSLARCGLDRIDTSIFIPSGMKMQTNPSSPTRKSPDASHQDFFSYIRLAASSIAAQCYWLAPVILGFAQFNGEYNITSASAEISLSRKAQYHSGVSRNITKNFTACYNADIVSMR